MKYFYEYTDKKQMKNMLKKCSVQNEYTIREKAAQIATLDDCFSETAELLKKDPNYYVRQVFAQ